MLRTRRVVSAFGVIAAVAALCQFGGAAVAGAQSQAPSQRVIVIFKNQETGLPATRSDVSARRHALQGIQAPVTRQLSSFGARNVHSYTVVNAVSATVSSSQESQLASNPAVSKVIPDQVIQLAPPASTGSGGSQGGLPGSTVCAPNGQVQLNPQALETIHADSDVAGAKTARSLGFTGAGVTVGFIADGLDTTDPDFIRANGQKVFVDYEGLHRRGHGPGDRRRGGVRRRQLDRRAGARGLQRGGLWPACRDRHLRHPGRGRGPGREPGRPGRLRSNDRATTRRSSRPSTTRFRPTTSTS